MAIMGEKQEKCKRVQSSEKVRFKSFILGSGLQASEKKNLLPRNGMEKVCLKKNVHLFRQIASTGKVGTK